MAKKKTRYKKSRDVAKDRKRHREKSRDVAKDRKRHREKTKRKNQKSTKRRDQKSSGGTHDSMAETGKGAEPVSDTECTKTEAASSLSVAKDASVEDPDVVKRGASVLERVKAARARRLRQQQAKKAGAKVDAGDTSDTS